MKERSPVLREKSVLYKSRQTSGLDSDKVVEQLVTGQRLSKRSGVLPINKRFTKHSAAPYSHR